MLSSADLHVGDFDFGKVLPVTGVTAIPGAACKPENPNLLVLAVPHDLGRDLGTLDVWLAALHFLAVARDEHVIERHLVSRLRIEQRDLDRDARLGAELTSAGSENRVAHRARNLNGDLGLVKRRRTARSRRGPPAEPSSEIRRAASSGHPGPRARGRFASPTDAGSKAPAR